MDQSSTMPNNQELIMNTDTTTTDSKDPSEEFTDEDPLKEEIKEEPPKNIRNLVYLAYKNVTVEVSCLLFILSWILTTLTSMNLNLEKACRVNLNFTEEICDALKTRDTHGLDPHYEREVQKLTASALSWKSYITASVPCAAALFIGSWTDRTGRRKMFIIIPIIGQFLMNISNILNIYFFYELRLEVLVFSEAILEGFSGAFCVAVLVCFSYIAAITDLKNRTFRMGIMNFCITVGFPIGMAISGPLLKLYGYYACYGFSASVHFLNLLYTSFVLRDIKRTKEQELHNSKGWRHLTRIFFDLTNVKESFAVVYRNGARISLLLATVSVCTGTFLGEIQVTYLLTRMRYNWDEVRFGLFQAYNFITHTIGVIFSVTVFSKYLQWHDAVLGIISTISKVASSFVYAFAYNDKIFFAAPLVEILNGTTVIAIRSMLSKLVQPDEFGKVNSIFSLTETLMPVLYIPLYTQVYTASMETFPGAMYLMTAAFMVPVNLVFSWLFYKSRQQKKIEKRQQLSLQSAES